VKNLKTEAFFILVLAVLAEYFHLLFLDGSQPIYHSQKILENGLTRIYYWDDLVYLWLNEAFTFYIIISIASKIWVKKPSRAMMSVVCFWFFIEFLEITLQLAKISDSRLYINDGSWLQLSTCITLSLLLLFGNKKLTS
jgi:hypothetical protein